MSSQWVKLGYEVGSGKEVRIPIRNMVVCGQTQLAGKTTALEGLISRAARPALSFVTKRGEGAFQEAKHIEPYFREQADWQYVAALLEASRGEKLKFERSWIIKASKGATTLRQVHDNIKRELKTARGINESVYTVLDAYLQIVVPVIESRPWAKTLVLSGGVNVVDLTHVPVEMQHLVIASCMDWVLEHAHQTIVVVPESWKFVPQGRGTPVKNSAHALIRQGSALGNHVWLDSQDIGGVDKETLRSCPVWLLGVQREINEVKRTLANLHVKNPKPADIAGLDIGQFFACFDTSCIKTYVQPEWRSNLLAQQVAMGDIGVLEVDDKPKVDKGAKVSRENEALQAENDRLAKDNATLRDEVQRLTKLVEGRNGAGADRPDESRRQASKPADETRSGVPSAIPRGAGRSGGEVRTGSDDRGRGDAGASGAAVSDEVFHAILNRLRFEAPAVLKMIVTDPEIEMKVERKTIQIDATSLKGRLAKLIAYGFFKDGKTPGMIRGELKRTGPDANTANIGRACDDLVTMGFLTDESSGYVAVAGMRVNILED